ncbi:iron-containing alcohol dehydrogenase [Fusibacter ferrireducens]|uniref:Iron-containing alcohol dehydrogenase n=1 Tax=Fusibacter ferrireducens TaxID=2785058 RepID=A0ABR9ZW91_9FIRM|nr:iron-containing alcohol dehydrogenase [Fusibacter ferrireducens]MBF4694720.1 iron-containing alcohol dehydrogenase [Fusibacter ferrireducens]
MKAFQYSMPTKIIFGKEKHKTIGNYLKPFAKHVLIHYGSTRIVLNGLLDEVTKSLESEGIRFSCLGGVQSNPSVELCNTGIQKCREENIDTILAIGGGSVIDSAKIISIGKNIEGDLWENLNRPEFISKDALNIATIVTLPAAGSEANGTAVISNYTLKKKVAISNELLIPKLSILNPELTYSLPRYQTAIAIVDIFSHCFERYFDLTRDCKLWDALCEATMINLVNIGNQFIENPEDKSFRDEMMWSATVAHSNMLGPGGDFACHQLAHALTVAYNIPHGGALALVMPAWCQHVSHKHELRFKCFFERVFNTDDIQSGIRKMQIFFEQLGAPIQFKNYFNGNVDIDKLIDLVYSNDTKYVGNGLEPIYPEDSATIFTAITKVETP